MSSGCQLSQTSKWPTHELIPPAFHVPTTRYDHSSIGRMRDAWSTMAVTVGEDPRPEGHGEQIIG